MNSAEAKEGLQRLFPDDWALEAGAAVLYGGRCVVCSLTFFPTARRCPGCLSKNVSLVPLSQQGRLYSFSVVRIETGRMKAPYAIGYVDLEGGPRVFAHLLGWENEWLKPDMLVRLTFGPLPLKDFDTPKLIYKFEPVSTSEPS